MKPNESISIILNSMHPNLTQITQLLNEKGLMVVKNALDRLADFPGFERGYQIVKKFDGYYRITEIGKNLWKLLFERNLENFSNFSKLIDKYVRLVEEIRIKEKEIADLIKKTRKERLRINNKLKDEFLNINNDDYEEKKLELNNKRKSLDNQLKKQSIDDLMPEIIEYEREKRKFESIEQRSEYIELFNGIKNDLEKNFKDLLFYEVQLNSISRELKVLNKVEEIETTINDADINFEKFKKEVENKEIFSISIFNEINDSIEIFEEFRDEREKNFI